MKRREFIVIAGGAAAAWPFAARAQQPARLRQVVILRGEVAGDPEGLRNSAALVQGLQALGWTQGHNIRTEQRWAGGSLDAMKALAKELVALEPDVIVVISTPVTLAVMQETHKIPFIFVQNFDPVGSGLGKSFVAPGVVLGVAGALSLAGGSSGGAVAPPGDTLTANAAVTVYEEEISDISLSTFYAFDHESARSTTARPLGKL